jgi:hypothetical protein
MLVHCAVPFEYECKQRTHFYGYALVKPYACWARFHSISAYLVAPTYNQSSLLDHTHTDNQEHSAQQTCASSNGR